MEAARTTSRQDNLNEDKSGEKILALSKRYGGRNTIYDDGMVVAKFEDTQALEAFLHDIENMECVDSFEILSNRKIFTADEFLLYGDQIVVVVYLKKNLTEAKEIDYDNIPTHRGTDNEYYDNIPTHRGTNNDYYNTEEGGDGHKPHHFKPQIISCVK